jgi:hypothetical protein
MVSVEHKRRAWGIGFRDRTRKQIWVAGVTTTLVQPVTTTSYDPAPSIDVDGFIQLHQYNFASNRRSEGRLRV